jgi:CubicO group peptidase (beta-lactamase class C family)
MSVKKNLFRAILVVVLAALSYGIYYAWNAFPIITGYGAKNLCSCTMLAGRQADEVIANELGSGMLALGNYSISYEDSSATATVFGVAKRKAIYRKGLGCTLVNEITEEELRKQPWKVVSPPPVNQDTIAWPNGNLIPESIPMDAYNLELLNTTVEHAFDFPDTRKTRAILVIHDGNIIAEKYADGFTKDSRLIGWSMTKSLTNAIVGVLLKEEKLTLNDNPFIDEWAKDERSAITLYKLMQASSGLQWEENYAGPSNATNMLFKKKDAGQYASTVPLAHTPGEVFYYSSGTTNILSWLTRKTIGDAEYHSFPYQQIFHKIGMYSMVMEPDPSGTFVGSSFSYATARDWARFGLLYLNDGYWGSERILPEGWVEMTATPAKGAPLGEYGMQFWLNAGAPDNPSKRTFPDVSTDLFYADGFEGQSVFILPSKNLVVVKLSQSTSNALDDNDFLKNIIAALPQ